MTEQTLTKLSDLIARARAAGADAADAVFISSTAIGAGVRNGTTEDLERSETTDLGLRVFTGQKSAIVSATTLAPARFEGLVEQALAMARVLPDDRFAGLAEHSLTGTHTTNTLDLADTAEPDAKALLARATEGEQAALAIKGVTNSAGSNASWGRTEVSLVTSQGFAGHYARTSHSTSVCVLAGQGETMQRDYDYHSTVHLADLENAAELGRKAGANAVARLNPTRPRTGRYPVVFHPRVANSFLQHFIGAISGASIARGTSFLKDKLNQRIFAEGVSITDDPTRPRGLRSRPFDGEGTHATPLALVQNGVLQTWLLDSRSARQLGLTSNGRAARGTSGPPAPSPTNLALAPGALSPTALMADIKEGLFITEMMGSSINGLTGDYSRGASGFMIRDGQLAEATAEFTLAGNLLDIFASFILANDLVFRFGTNAPTLRTDALNVAGA
ncbi:TldD/PmbA family protein [Acetobacter orientalis]|uniref:Modulator protein n=1 Tax=Acetobacter orientalis TaxID=146474 RepID=A0A2Z5ZFS6_9PROT|nr:TldD/PmbA family protein [Acetobacter orientalis]BBC79097.1 modulator protein [Acetobacter orientalis]GAN65183.1 Zn-dependent microcin-processing peptidase U62/PmbA/TldD [Acetobacter orientalis]GBR17853.1 zinc-dependent microcin-processing U62/PmbA/TldD [Acetobacter orientalis NRIC 0481]GEL61510.1 modulator protein [Acetobacter orientalis]